MPEFCFWEGLSASCSLGTLSGRDCLLRAHATCAAMLRVRGFARVEGGAAELPDRMRAGEPVLRGCDSDRGRPDLLLYFHCSDARVGIQAVREIEAAAAADAADPPLELCMVSVEGPTAFTRREVGDRVQFLCFKHVSYDLSRHCLVPPHRLLPPEEAAEVAVRFEVRGPEQWPHLLLADPVARFHGFRRGDLVEILRHGAGTNGLSVYYRLVV